MSIVPFRWLADRLDVLDQRLLPHEAKFISCETPADVADAIRDMAVRGAPAIGCCAAYGVALALKPPCARDGFEALNEVGALLKASRPTAVNLAWAVGRMLRVWEATSKYDKSALYERLVQEAQRIEREDLAGNEAMGRFGAALLKPSYVILTHCNAGALATAGFGTALGIIRQAFREGKIKKVFVDETRPYLQGARLTAWELDQEGIPHELITDNMAGYFMQREKVDGVLVGCDRVAANGDTANKIGTYSLSILAQYHRIPFYVAMPTSTLDLTTSTGQGIPIEERSSEEVVHVGGKRIAPHGTRARHPAFDVTPAALISAFVSEKGVVRPPFEQALKALGSAATEMTGAR